MNANRLSAETLDRVNAAYQKVIDTIIPLASAALLLPILILKEFMGLTDGTPLIEYLNWKAWLAWIALAISIASGAGYYFASAKWIKHGQAIDDDNKWVKALDWTFWCSVALFIIGLGLLMAFYLTYETKR